jgi:hypothetical protein
VFARKIDDGLIGLIKQVDAVLSKNSGKKIYGTVVMLSNDADALGPKLEALAKEHDIKKVPLTVADAGEAGPAPYKISKDATFTVVVYDSGKKVTNVFALDAIDAKAQEAAVAAFAEVAGVSDKKDAK